MFDSTKMSHTSRDMVKSLQDSILNNLLWTIRTTINNCGGRIEFGNTILKNDLDSTTLIKINDDDFVKLYSDEGYNKLEDIAHWADIVLSYYEQTIDIKKNVIGYLSD